MRTQLANTAKRIVWRSQTTRPQGQLELTKNEVRRDHSPSATKLVNSLALPPPGIIHVRHIAHVQRQQHVLPVQGGAEEVLGVHCDRSRRFAVSQIQSVVGLARRRVREVSAEILEC